MLSPEDLRHLSKLAKIKINDQETPIYLNSLNKLIDILSSLEKVELDPNIDRSAFAHQNLIHLRDDIAIPVSTQDDCEKNAPQILSHFYIVPPVIEGE